MTDNVAMKAGGKQIEAVEMLMMNSVEGRMGKMREDGVIGFTPRKLSGLAANSYKYDSLASERHSPFLTQIYKKNLISKKMFAMHTVDDKSMMWLGGYPKQYLKDTFP